MYYSLLSIALGSVLGAWLRWFLGLKLNPIYPQIPLGTVTVKTKDIVFIRKSATDTLEGGAALKVVSVAFSD